MSADGATPAGATTPPHPLRSIAGNASMLAAGRLASRCMAFALSLVLARGLGPDGYGTYALGAAIVTIAIAVCDLGLSPYATREAARNREALDASLGRVLRIRLTLAAAGGVLVGAWVVADPSDVTRAIGILYVGMTIESIAYLGFSYMQGLERARPEAITVTVATAARAAGGIAVVLTTGSLELTLAWLALVALAELGSAAFFLRRAGAGRRGASTASTPVRVLLRSGGAMMLVALAGAVTLRADSIVIGAFETADQVGQYTAAYALVTGVQVVAWILAVAMYPVMARSFGRDEGVFLGTWHNGVRAAVVLTLPAALIATVLAGDIIGRIYGDEYAPAARALEILMWWVPLTAITAIFATLLRVAGWEGRLAAIVGAGAAANVLLNLFMVPLFGFVGAVWVTVGLEFAMLVVMAIMALRIGVPLPRLAFLWRTAPAALGLCAAALVLRSGPVEVSAATGIAAYALLLIAFGAVTRGEAAAVLNALRPRRLRPDPIG